MNALVLYLNQPESGSPLSDLFAEILLTEGYHHTALSATCLMVNHMWKADNGRAPSPWFNCHPRRQVISIQASFRMIRDIDDVEGLEVGQFVRHIFQIREILPWL